MENSKSLIVMIVMGVIVLCTESSIYAQIKQNSIQVSDNMSVYSQVNGQIVETTTTNTSCQQLNYEMESLVRNDQHIQSQIQVINDEIVASGC